MTITLNGKPYSISDGMRISNLLGDLGLLRPGVAVEVNHEVIPRERHQEVILASGDVVEVVSLVGGG